MTSKDIVNTVGQPIDFEAVPTTMRVSERIKLLQKKILYEDNSDESKENNSFEPPQKASRLKRGDIGYGTAKDGSKSAARVSEANSWVNCEIDKLMEIIQRNATKIDSKSGFRYITFGALFNMYVDLSNSLVGTLLRARKRKLIAYEGEILYQGKDDSVRITILP